VLQQQVVVQVELGLLHPVLQVEEEVVGEEVPVLQHLISSVQHLNVFQIQIHPTNNHHRHHRRMKMIQLRSQQGPT
jgi:hypothetical protein